MSKSKVITEISALNESKNEKLEIYIPHEYHNEDITNEMSEIKLMRKKNLKMQQVLNKIKDISLKEIKFKKYTTEKELIKINKKLENINKQKDKVSFDTNTKWVSDDESNSPSSHELDSNDDSESDISSENESNSDNKRSIDLIKHLNMNF